MHQLRVIILVTSCLASCYCKTLNQKNGGTVHFDNEEVYSSYPPRKVGQGNRPTTPLPSESDKPVYPPGMMNGPLQPPPQENQNRIDLDPKPMEAMPASLPAMGFNPMPLNGNPQLGSSHPYPYEYPLQYAPFASSVAANIPEEASTQNRVNGKGPSKVSIDDILNKPEAVDVPQAVLEKKKDVMQDARISSILQRGITQMTLDMDRAIRAQGGKYENVVFAPLSIIGALALVLLGADGATKSELINFMGIATGRNLDNKSDLIHETLGGFFDALTPKPGAPMVAEVQVANGVFYEDRFKVKKQYEQLAKKFYKSEIFPLDFGRPESAMFVNKWVSNRTMGKIENLLPGPLSPQITLILANVIYFNGKWELPFLAKYNTWDLFDFYSGNGHKEMVRVEMMTNMARVEYINTPEAQILGLPYKGREVYMYFIVPRNPNLEEYTKDLDYTKFSEIIDSTIKVEVIYSIPKLKISSSIELRPVLNAMNVTSMFDVSKSDLSNMLMEDGSSRSGVAVDQVFHKVDIDINEEGTEAAASTGIIITRISKPIVKVNRPFIFFIYHRPTNSIVFWGSMYKPDPHRPLQRS